MTVIARLNGVARSYADGLKALGPLNLEIRESEFLSLLGPSGCGKSTALRLIAGLLEPTAGEITWPHGKPRIGFVFQDPTLMPWRNARDNVRLPLDLQRVAREEANRRAAAALERVGLSGFESAYPRALSGGMRMRVSLARALAARPQVLLMDEPFAALDELTRQSLNDDLLTLWRDEGLTVVFVTHSVSESTYLSTRTVVLTPRPGRVACDIAFSRTPSPDPSFRFTPGFTTSARRVSEALREAMKAAA
jgi:NitT/TauT family transport system ATP-binding protein